MEKVKNLLIVILMIAIVVGTVFGVKYEIDTFNADSTEETA